MQIKIKHVKENVPVSQFKSVLAMTDPSKGSRGAIALMALPYIFKMGYNQVEKGIANEDKKHTAIYSGFTSDDIFYNGTSEDATVNVGKITLYRTIQVSKHKRDTAFILSLIIEGTHDGNFLRFVPEQLRVNYAKAKLLRRDEFLDIDASVLLTTNWVDIDKSYKSENVGPLELTFYNVPLRHTLTEKDFDGIASAWFPIIPRSKLGDNIYGTGNYSIRINIKEYDEYGENVVKMSDKFNFENNRLDVKSAIDDISKEVKTKQEQKALENQK